MRPRKLISIANYGVPERIWLFFWAVMTVVWTLCYGQVDDFWAAQLENVLLVVGLLTIPIYIQRFGGITLNVTRAFFSFLSSWFAYLRVGSLIPALHPNTEYEVTMINIDKFIFGGNPSEWFQAIQHPILSEYFQLIYLFYFPEMLIVGLCLVYVKKRRIFLRYLITMNLALMFTHIFYVIVPLRSPFWIVELGLFTEMISYDKPLKGLWFFEEMRSSLTEATTMRHDCFPSGHTMHSLLAMVFAWKVNRFVGTIETIIAISIVISTLYLRYHYAIDLIVGAGCAGMWYYLGGKITNYALPLEPIPIEDD